MLVVLGPQLSPENVHPGFGVRETTAEGEMVFWMSTRSRVKTSEEGGEEMDDEVEGGAGRRNIQ